MNEPRRIMVLLGGGRIAPNIAAVLSLRPDEVRFLISEDQPNTYRDMMAVLGQFPWLRSDAESISVPANDLETVRAVTASLLEDHQDADVILNVTCGTKTMAVGVYEAAKAYNRRVIYVDSFHNRIIDWTWPDQEDNLVVPTLGDYLANFGRRPKEKLVVERLTTTEHHVLAAACELGKAGSGAAALLAKLRKCKWQVSSPNCCISGPFDVEELDMLQMLAQHRIVREVDQLSSRKWCCVIREASHWDFVRGDWLEIYTYAQAESLTRGDGQPLFDRTALSLEMPAEQEHRGKREIDFAGLYGWQLVWASCKTGANQLDKKSLDEVAMLNSMIGGRYATPLYICTEHSTAPGVANLLEHAHRARIVVVLQDQLPELGDILAREATRPTYPRI